MRQYSFDPRFSRDILSGKKTMTIRRVWKTPVRKGDLLCLHIDLPGSNETVAVKVSCAEAYLVEVSAESVRLRTGPLSSAEMREFIRRDGFRTREDMLAFFERRYSLPFSGQCICWQPVRDPEDRRGDRKRSRAS